MRKASVIISCIVLAANNIISAESITAGGCAGHTSQSSCSGSCVWNFVSSCCYEKGGPNCAISTSYISTRPEIDRSHKVGIDSPGSEATSTLNEVPLAPVEPPKFGPTSMGGQSNMLMGNGITNGIMGGTLPGVNRLRR